MKNTFHILVLILLGCSLAACGGGSGGPTDTSNYNSYVLFAETWESYPIGSFPGGGWKEHPRPYTEKKIEIPDNHKMSLKGPSGQPTLEAGGIYYPFKPGTMMPTYIRYNIHPYAIVGEPGNISPPYRRVGNFAVTGNYGYSESTLGLSVEFLHDGNGNGYIITSGGVIYPGTSQNEKIPIDRSFLIEIKNIHWDTYPNLTFDFWVDGNQVESCIPFPQTIESITAIHFYNREYEWVHIDNIFMADLPYDNTCIVIDEPAYPDTMPLPPLPSPSPLLIFFEINLNAFCRSGPGTDYPALTTFPEGTQLEISAQNLESTWWYSSHADCWMANSVGELKGDPTNLQVIIPPPPPPPEEQDTGEESPGKPSSCYPGLGQDACLEAGGAWDDQPGQPGKCICQ